MLVSIPKSKDKALSERSVTSHSKSTVCLAGFVAVSLLLAIGPASHLASFAYHTGEQSYILLVPAVCAALIYYSRDRILTKSEAGFSLRSLLWLTPGLVLLLLGYLLESGSELQLVTTAIGFILFWVAAFRACFGPKSLRAAAFELGMLVWIIPIPQPAIDWITVTLQRQSADVVDWLFALCRVPVFRSGFIFTLPGQSIEVAKQCSGIRSTLSLLFLTLILAHESLRGNWRRFVLVLCALPIVVLKNGVRIVTLTLLAIYVDPSFLTGSLHHDGGIVFFLLGLVLLMPIIALLRRGEPKPPMAQAAVGQD